MSERITLTTTDVHCRACGRLMHVVMTITETATCVPVICNTCYYQQKRTAEVSR